MKISVIIPIFNKIEIIARCIELNIRHADQLCEWVIIDNASDAPTKEGLKKLEVLAKSLGHHVQIITESKNTGVAVAWNKGLRESSGDYICILNNDCVMMPGWCAALLGQPLDLCSPLVLEPVMFGYKYNLEEFLEGKRNYKVYLEKNKGIIRSGFFGGVILFAHKDIFKKVGDFDERFWLSLEEMDYLYRAKKLGITIGTAGSIVAFHYSGATRNSMNIEGGKSNQTIFEAKWGWNYEREENRWFNRLIRKWQKRCWYWLGIMSKYKLIFPKP